MSKNTRTDRESKASILCLSWCFILLTFDHRQPITGSINK